MNFSCSTEVETAALQILRDIPPNRFRREIEKLKLHLQSVIESGGSYVIENIFV